MGDPSTGPTRGRRKSLLDIGMSLGVLDSSQTLPRGFETPIAPPLEELHLTPRSRDISPGPHSHSADNSSTGTGSSTHELRSPARHARSFSKSESRSASSEPSVVFDELSDDGPRLMLERVATPPRETLFEPVVERVEPEIRSPPIAVPAARSSMPDPSSSISPVDHQRHASADPHLNPRFAHLSGNIAYSSTTPNPRTSSSPLSGALSFFSKIFTPIQELAQSAASSIATSSTPPNGSPDARMTLNGSSPAPYSRNSNEIPRSNSASPHHHVLSTRPPTLPPKSAQEELKHREQYIAMVAAYQERTAAQKAKSEQKQKLKDDKAIAARSVWASDILPHWEKKKRTKVVYDLIMQGIPPFVRTKVWPLLLGNDVNITKDLFRIYVKQAEAGKAARAQGAAQVGKLETAKLIGVDLPRTFPALAFYQEGGPNHAELHRVLDAYVCYRPDIGYVQGMSYLAAILLLYLDDYMAFTCLANLLNRPVHMAFYKMEGELQQFISLFETLFKRSLPELYTHFESIGLTSDMYLLDWVLTIFSKSLPLDTATRLWDVYIFEGQSFFFRASIGILKYAQEHILKNDLDLGPCKKILARMPEEMLDEESLLATITSVTLKEHEDLLLQLQVSLFKL